MEFLKKNIKGCSPLNLLEIFSFFYYLILEIIIFYFIMFSLSVGLFNLLPFFGLDGGWIFISIINLFVKFSKNGERILIRTLNYGTILLFVFMFFLVFKDLWSIFLDLIA